MEGEKVVIDKLSMSLDDIIKMERKKLKKSKNNSNFLRTSYNKAKNTLINKRRLGGTFNRNRLGMSNKRNIIKSNIIINKRINTNSTVKRTFSKPNQGQNLNIQNRPLMRNNNRQPINTSTKNNNQFAITRRNNFVDRSQSARNNNERPQFNNNGRTFVRKMFRGSNDGFRFNKPNTTPYSGITRSSLNQGNIGTGNRYFRNNLGSYNMFQQNKFGSYNRQQNSGYSQNSAGLFNQGGAGYFNQRYNNIVRANLNKMEYPINNVRRNSFNANTMRGYPISQEVSRRYENNSGPFSQPKRYIQNNDYTKINRTQENEYEAMARALIVAHRDSKSTYNQVRGYDNRGGNVYRR